MTTTIESKTASPRRYAVLSMDIEDWYHLDYFDRSACDRDRSLLDGVEVYRELLAQHGVPSSFFVLGELVDAQRELLRELAKEGHDIGVHGWSHVRPLTMAVADFAQDLGKSKKTLEDAIGGPVSGYRAPCFSLDRERLDIVSDQGFAYDSSRIEFADHPLYGTIKLDGFETISPNIYRNKDFFEFQMSTLPLLGKQVPVSGGGYIRLFPWFLMRRLVKSYLNHNELYVLYIHPFELSPQPPPPVPAGTGWATRVRFERGRSSVGAKLSKLIALLKANQFRFTTFAALRNELTGRPTETN